jgi:hypothetical protein
MAIEDAKDIKQLSDEAMALLQASLRTYQEVGVRAWERATGSRAYDQDEVAKDTTTVVGTMARDLGNAAMVWQTLARIAAPAPAGETEADPST